MIQQFRNNTATSLCSIALTGFLVANISNHVLLELEPTPESLFHLTSHQSCASQALKHYLCDWLQDGPEPKEISPGPGLIGHSVESMTASGVMHPGKMYWSV